MNTSILERITQDQFLAVYYKHKPNDWIKFAFRYFSQNTKTKDEWLKEVIVITLIALFSLGFLLTIFTDFKAPTIKAATYIFAIILCSLGVLMGGAAIMNNFRLRRIRRELRVTKQEYDFLQNAYLP